MTLDRDNWTKAVLNCNCNHAWMTWCLLLQIVVQIGQRMSSGKDNSCRVPMITKHHINITYLKWIPHFGVEKQIYHNPDIFISVSHRELAPIGIESIGLWYIRTKYINFLMGHTRYVWVSYPTIRWDLLRLLSLTPSMIGLYSALNPSAGSILSPNRGGKWMLVLN